MDCIYITNDQAARLVGLSCDTVLGMQVSGDDESDTRIQVAMIDINNLNRSRHFEIEADGSMTETT